MLGKASRRMTHRILIVDDSRQVERLLRTSLEQSDYEITVAHDGETALRILRQERPDLMILDLIWADWQGLEATRVTNGIEGLAAMPVIMLTGRSEHGDRAVEKAHTPGLEAGSVGEATHPFDSNQVIARLLAVLRHMQAELVPSKVIQVGQVRIDLEHRQVRVGGKPLRLTPTEFALLQALAEQPGHALTRTEMIELGLDNRYEGLERTVDSHIKNLRRKLDEAGGAAYLIETVFGIGYRLAEGESGKLDSEEEVQVTSTSL